MFQVKANSKFFLFYDKDLRAIGEANCRLILLIQKDGVSTSTKG